MPSHKRWTNLFASWMVSSSVGRRRSGLWQNANGLRRIVLAAAAVTWAVAPVEAASRPVPEPVKIVRELLVPMEDLNVLLENQPRRVLLSREEYETLLEKAHAQGEAKPPRAAVLTDSDYSARLSDGRALIEGTLRVDVLDEGMCAVPLDLSRVGLKEATLDGQPAAIGRDKDERLMLLVEGRGQHELRLSLTAPIETTAATQIFSFRLPTAPSARFHLAVDGDVEVKGGLDVVSRRFDSDAGVTRFELLPRDGDVSLVMTLNSHLRRKDQIVIARTVLLAALAEAGEQCHATTSFSILHRAVDRFRFVVPEGVEITNVDSPHLSSWAVVERDGRRVLEAKLREATTDKVVLSIGAIRAAPRLDEWSLPRLTPLDTDGEATVVGVLVDQRIKPKTIDSKGLIPIDAADLRAALPPSMRDEPALVPLAAYYAPGGDYALGASFEKPPARFTATTVLLLTLSDRQQRLTANVLLAPEHEPLFEVDLRLPAAWHVDQVADAQGRPMTFERHDKTDRLHVRLGRGIPAGGEGLIRFTATATPDTWLGDWKTTEVAFPDVDLPAGQRRRGAIAVIVQDDLEAHPEDQTGLIPLDDADKKDYQLAGVTTDLAYRHEDGPWKATLRIERTTPRLTARTYSFLDVAPGTLTAHYEIVYDATEARARTLRFRLPSTTPGDLAIRGLGGAALKEYSSTTTEQGREWIVPLVEPRRGTIALAVDFQQPLGDRDPRNLALPIIAAEGVAHQSGLVAVEGNAELDVRVTTDARPVDVGELVDAEYQPGRRLLGVHSFVGEPVPVTIDAYRYPAYALATAVVQRGRLTTRVSAEGVAQTKARFELRAKAPYLEIELPPKSQLWSVWLDGKPAKPQRQDQRLLLDLAGQGAGASRELQFFYETPLATCDSLRDLDVGAPRLLLRADQDAPPSEVPLVGLEWQLVLPWRYHVVDSRGTLTSGAVEPTEPALFRAARWLGKTIMVRGSLGCSAAREAARRRPVAVYCEALEPAEEAYVLEEKGGEIETETSGHGAGRGRLRRSSDEKIRVDYDYDLDEVISEDQHQTFAQTLSESSKPDAQTEMAGKAAGGYGDFHAADFGLKGRRSPKVDFEQAQAGSESTVVTFRSLGEDPRLVVTVADRRRFASLGWALALAVVLVGVAMGGRSTGAKFRLLVVLGLVFSLVPLVPGCQVLAEPLNMAFYATLLLVPYFLLLAGGRWFLAHFEVGFAGKRAASAAGAVLLVLAATAGATADEPRGGDGLMRVEVVDPLPEVRVPVDAILIPYDPDSPGGIENANRCFVPYDQYRELWSRANPDRTPPAAPCDYALAGASYEARLADGDDLLLAGQIEIVVNKPSGVMVPLRLAGGVLAEAQLDGKPARLSVTQTEPAPGKASSGPRTAVLLLHVSETGRHTLKVRVRLRLARHGGWHVAEGVVPAAPASALVLTVPAAETDVQFGETADRRNFETAKPDEKIETVLGDGGRLRVEWRPKLARTEIEHSLTARSEALFDVQEDAARMIWDLELAFRQDQRRQFTVVVPEDWRIESVAGPNVRGWQSTVVGKTQRIDVSLLKPAAGSERISLKLRRPGLSDELTVPVVAVDGAAIERGRVAIRRSPLLELRTTAARGVRRADFALPPSVAAGQAALDDPLGLRPYQAYEFASTPFSITLAAGPVRARTTAAVQSILRISDDQRSLESLVNLDVQGRPIYSAAFLLPEEFELEDVDVLAPDFERNPAAAGGLFHWAITQKDQPRPRLTVFLADGRLGRVPIVLRGKLGGETNASATALPRLDALGVERQSGDVAVQVDPSFRVEPRELANCESVLLHRLFGWLRPDQRALTQLALHYDRPDIEGRLVLSRRSPRVSCTTITNVRVTDRAIEETILLDFAIREAGIRQIVFTLPAWMRDCRIEVPMLREKTIAPTGPGADAPLRVTLDLQDEVMADAFRVLVKNDRLLTPGLHSAPIPVVATGETTRRFAVLESAGRDEVVPDDAKTSGLEPVNPRSKSYGTLRQLLGEGITQAYLVAPGAERPALAFRTRQREAVATAGARIGLAETDLLVDASGAYRGRIVFHMDNSTEQFLPIKMPRGARLWSAQVAGEPVKPIRHPDASDDLHVCIPLIKTSAGELDYQIELIYGGRMAALGSLGDKVEFPLLRTLDPRGKINLTPELSQVRLHLPRTHRWFDFDGTMRLVADEGLLAAGQVAYRNSRISQLSQTMQTGDEFAKIRAAENLTGLQKQVGMAVRNASELNDNALFRKEMADNEQLFEKAQQQAEIVKNAPQQAAEDDNRERLGSLYLKQRVNASRGAVSKAGQNFGLIEAQGAKVIVGAERHGGVKVNNQWYRNNNLIIQQRARSSVPPQSSHPVAAPAYRPPAAGEPASTEGRAGIHDGMLNANGAAIDRQTMTWEMMGGPGDIPSGGIGGIQEGAQLNRPMVQSPATPQQTMQPAPAKKPMSKGARYQQRYQEQAGQAAGADARNDGRSWSDSRGEHKGTTCLVDTSEEAPGFSMGFQRTPRGKPADARVRYSAVAAPPATPSGLASLAIDFPTPEDAVYRTYRFTTPRGDVRITARPASVETLWTGRAVLIILVVFAALVLLVRTRLARWFATWPGGLTLVAIGALLTISCVMPLIGIVLAAAGIAVLVSTRKSRPAKTAAAK